MNRRRRWTGVLPLLPLLLPLLSATTHAQTLSFAANEPVAASAGAATNERPRVASTDDGSFHILWAKGVLFAEGAFVVSAPAGGSYGNAVMVSDSMDGVTSGGGYGPTLRATGSFLVAGWEDRLPLRGVWVARSTDMGSSWEPALRASPVTEANRAFQAAAVFPDGRMSQTWMAYQFEWSVPRHDWTGQDAQGIFSPPIEATAAAAGEACPCCYADQIILDDGQTVLVGFRNNEDNLREIHVARSTDSGASFPSDTRVDTSGWIIQGCPSTGPGLAAAGDTVLACWMAAPAGVAHIWLARSLDGGASWEAMRQVDDGDGTTYINDPQVAIRGTLAVVVWEAADTAGRPAILAAASTNAGQSWGESITVTDDPGFELKTQAAVAIAPNLTVEVAWHDERTGSPRIFHARGQADPVGVAEPTPVATAPRLLAPSPNPFRPVTHIAFALPRAGHVRLVIFDTAGRRRAVPANGTFPAGLNRVAWAGDDGRGRSLPSGVYMARLEAAGYTGCKKLVILR